MTPDLGGGLDPICDTLSQGETDGAANEATDFGPLEFGGYSSAGGA